MLIKDIFMELRSRLRSCNVYITTGIDFSKSYNLKINIQSGCIVLNYYNNDYKKRRDSLSSIESLSDNSEDESMSSTTVIYVEKFCHLIPNSISCLKIENNNISFRILTEPKNNGNFYSEVLSSNVTESTIKKKPLKINVKINNEMKLLCSNCSNVISAGFIKFDRILELPSSNMDMSEWFCHGHGHGHSHNHESDNAVPIDITVSPNKNDFLYHHTYFLINNFILSEDIIKFNKKRDVFHCNRCLAWLGNKEKTSVKFFNSDVKFNLNGEELLAFGHKLPIKDLCVEDFIYTIESVAKEFNLGFQYAIMCKMVLEVTVSSNKQFILIWIMDKELEVLRNSNDCTLSNKIDLQSSFLTKVLYKTALSSNDEVENWLSDPAVVSTNISKSMFGRGLEHLEKMSHKMPESFRNTNGFSVSYLKV